MQHLSFDAQDPVFTLGSWSLSFQLISLDNTFGLDPTQTRVEQIGDHWHIDCSRLSWAGQQQHAPGSISIEAFDNKENNQLHLQVKASAQQKIRCIKILIRDLPPIQALDMLDMPEALPSQGWLKRYPNDIRIPLLFANAKDGTRIGVRCADPHARAKRFAIYQENYGSLAGTHTIECIHEEDARWFETSIEVPEWIIARDPEITTFREDQLAFSEELLGLIPWEQRTDVPGWARDIRLCLTLHGMHWSGYTFNTYDQMMTTIKYVTERISGHQVLVYLPGWEGRYYWQYGDYRPEPLLGGEEGFDHLCQMAKNLGVHIMPMFGVNCANAWHPNFHTYGPDAYMKSATRNRFHGNQPDWDVSRAHDTGWQAWLNPGAPAWQHELTHQISTLKARYDFDAIFLDTTEVWVNDPDFNIRDGLQHICSTLYQKHPELLITAEDWWDGLLGVFPIFQDTSAWREVPNWVGKYARLIGHICQGEASRGSTGVFESGHAAYVQPPHLAPHIPTIAFVDGTLENAADEVDAIIDLAQSQF